MIGKTERKLFQTSIFFIGFLLFLSGLVTPAFGTGGLQSPFLIYQDFESSTSTTTFLSQGSAATGCGNIAGTNTKQAYFNGNVANSRSLVTSPVGVLGSQRISFAFYSGLRTGTCPSYTAPYNSISIYYRTGSGSYTSADTISPISIVASEERYYTQVITPPTGLSLPGTMWKIAQPSSPAATTDVWAVDNLEVTCNSISCSSATNSASIASSDLSTVPSFIDTSSTAVYDGAQLLSNGDKSNCNVASTKALWMRGTPSTSSRVITTTSLDFSTGGLLSFDFNVPTYCTAGISYCDCSAQNPPVWINEVVVNPKNLAPNDASVTLSLVFAGCSGGANAGCRYTAAMNYSGFGFEIAGTPGTDISGYKIVVIGEYQNSNSWAYTVNTGADNILRTETPPSSGPWLIATKTLPSGSILVADSAATSSAIGLASFSYHFEAEASCIFAGKNAGGNNFGKHACHVLLMDPSQTQVYHRFVINPNNYDSTLDFFQSEYRTTGGGAKNVPIPCVTDPVSSSTRGTSVAPVCYTRLSGLVSTNCTNCWETTWNPSNPTTLQAYYTLADSTTYYCGTSDITYSYPAANGCGKRISVFDSGVTGSYCMLPTGNGNCFTLDASRSGNNCKRTLFTSDDSTDISIPVASSTVKYISTASYFARANIVAGGSTNVAYSCTNLISNAPPVDCCGVASNESYVQVEGRPNPSASWRGLESLTLDSASGGDTSGWVTHYTLIPTWLQTSTAQIRWRQTYITGTPTEGLQVWGIDNIAVVNQNPVAAASGHSLLLSASSTGQLKQTALSSLSGDFTIFFLANLAASDYITLLDGSGFTISYSNAAVNGAGNEVTFKVKCNPSTTKTVQQTLLSGAGTWVPIYAIKSASSITVCANSVCNVLAQSCTAFNSSTLNIGSATGGSWGIDELRIHSSALTTTFLNSVNSRLLFATESTSSNLVAYWNFDEGACGSLGYLATSSNGQGEIYGTQTCQWKTGGADLQMAVYLNRASATSLTFSLLGVDYETDSSSLTYQLVSLPTCGKLYFTPSYSLATTGTTFSGNLFYQATVPATTTCAPAYQDTFQYQVIDGRGLTDTGTATISMTADVTSYPPEAISQTIYYLDTNTFAITLQYYGSDGTTTTGATPYITQVPVTDSQLQDNNNVVLGVSSPLNSPPLKYVFGTTIISNWNTAVYNDNFKFTAHTSTLASTEATVTLTRRAPLAFADTFSSPVAGIPGFASIDIASLLSNDYFLNSDASSGFISITSVGSDGFNGATANGGSVIIGTGNIIQYTVPVGFEGVDTFKYTLTLNVSIGYTSTGTVSITVVNNTNPTATAGTSTTNENTDVGITLTGTGYGELMYLITSLPSNGDLYETTDGVTPSTNIAILSSDLPYQIPGNKVLYRPNSYYNGGDSFNFETFDADLKLFSSASATISITIDPVPSAPQALSFSVTVITGTPTIHIDLCPSQVLDYDGVGANCAVTSIPTQGTLKCDDGTNIIASNIPYTCSGVTYNVPGAYIGTDIFQFSATRAASPFLSTTGTVTINIQNPDSLPHAFGASIVGTEDTNLTITLSDYVSYTGSVNTLLYYISKGASNGLIWDTQYNSGLAQKQITVTPTGTGGPANLILNNMGQLIYVPNPNFNGPDSFVWYCTDQTGVFSEIVTVSISITAVNDAPSATDSSVPVVEDTPTSFSVVAGNIDGGPLTYTIIFDSILGSLKTASNVPLTVSPFTSSESSFVYTPSLNFFGKESIQWYATTVPGLDSNTATVTFVVSNVEDPPVAGPVVDQNINEDTVAISILLVASDPDFDSLTYWVGVPPLNGNLYQSADAATPSGSPLGTNTQVQGSYPDVVIYVPNLNYHGVDTFTYYVNDGTLNSNTATVTINVASVDDPPVVYSTTISTNEGVDVVITLNASNVDTASIITTILSTPRYSLYNYAGSQGSLLASGDQTATLQVYYTPPARGLAIDYSYPVFDYFFYMATALNLNSTMGIQSIHINNLNDPPTAQSQTLYCWAGSTLTGIRITFDDPDLVTSPQNLLMDISAVPSSGVLKDSLDNTVTTSSSYSNQIPGSSEVFSYDCAAGGGNYTFTYRFTDSGSLNSGDVSIYFVVFPTNAAPTVPAISASTNQATPVNVTLSASDDYSSTVNFVIIQLGNSTLGGDLYDITNPGSPVLVTNAQSLGSEFLQFVPFPSFYGSVYFYYGAIDNYGVQSSSGMVVIDVVNSNTAPPVAQAAIYSLNEDGTVTFTLTYTDSDPTTTAPTYQLTLLPTHGSLTWQSNPVTLSTLISDPADLTYTPQTNYYGVDDLFFKVKDNNSVYGPAAQITFLILYQDDAPSAVSQTVFADKLSGPLPIHLLGTDLDTFFLTFKVTTLPSQGTLSAYFLDGSGNIYFGDLTPVLPVVLTYNSTVYYTPYFNASGYDFFQFEANDGVSDSTLGNVTIIIATLDTPLALPASVSTFESRSIIITVDGVDTQPSGGNLTFQISSLPSHGTLFLESSFGTTAYYNYTPTAYYIGPDSFQFYVTDSTNIDSTPALVYISVFSLNQPPICIDSTETVTETVIQTLTMNAKEIDTIYNNYIIAGYTIVNLPPYGTLYYSGTSTPIPIGASLATNYVDFLIQVGFRGTNATYFDFMAYDANGLFSLHSGTVYITVLGANDPPSLQGGTVTTIQGSGVLIQMSLYYSDPGDFGIHTITILGIPSTGVLSQVDSSGNPTTPIAAGDVVSDSLGRIWYEPDPTFSCSDLLLCPYLQYDVFDGFLNSSNPDQGRIYLQVFPIVTAPVIVSSAYITQTLITPEDTGLILPFYSWIKDSDIRSLRYQMLGQLLRSNIYPFDCATNTTYVQIISGAISTDCGLYVPDLNLFSNPPAGGILDNIEWVAIDNTTNLQSDAFTINFEVTAVNDAPTVQPLRASTIEGRPVTIQLSAFDVEGDNVTIMIIKSTVLGGLYQYDGSNPPHFQGNRILGSRTLLTDPEKRVVYVPPQDRFGSGLDFFLYKGCDSFLCGNNASVTIDVSANSPPFADPQNVVTNEDTMTLICLTGSDPNSDPITPYITFLPLNGKIYQAVDNTTRGVLIDSTRTIVTNSNGCVFYLPPLNANGQDYDSFGFNEYDGRDFSVSDATVTIDVNPVPDPPVSRNVVVSGQQENTLVSINLGGTTPDGTPLQSIIVSLPLNGVLAQSSNSKVVSRYITVSNTITSVPTIITDPRGKVLYLPNQYWYGTDYFSFQVQDKVTGELSSISNVTMEILAVNNPPTIYNITRFNDKPQTPFRIQLNSTDVDNTEPPLYVVNDLPVNASVYQATDSGDLAEEIFLGNTFVSNADGYLWVRSAQGLMDVTFSYFAVDINQAASDLGYFWTNVTAVPPPPPGVVPIGAIAGAAAGISIGLCALFALIYWWYRKRERENFDMTKSLGQRRSSKDMLEKLLIEPELQVVKALADSCDKNENDRLGRSLVTLFASNAAAQQVIMAFISKEIRSAKNPASVFSSDSLTSKMVKEYSRLIGGEFLKTTLGPLLETALTSPGYYEVNPSQLRPDQNLETQWEHLIGTTGQILDVVLQSTENCPPQLRKLYAFVHREAREAFPDYHNWPVWVGSFFFLRFFCPAIARPEFHGLCLDAPSNEIRRGLILLMKSIQNIAQGQQFSLNQEFMMPMNDFIVENVHRIRGFLEGLAEFPLDTDTHDDFEIDSLEKLGALEHLHWLIFVNQEKIDRVLADQSTTSNLNRDYLEHLATLALLLSYPIDAVESVTDLLVSNIPLVTAICQSLKKDKRDDELARAIITIFEAHAMTIDLLKDLVSREVESTTNVNMLFRGYSSSMRMCKEYIDIIGLSYLQQNLGVLVKLVINDPAGYEIDPNKVSDRDMLTRNQEKLMRTCEEILSNLLSSVYSMPPQIRVICNFLFNTVENGPFAERKYACVLDLLFGRIICPAILTPLKYNIVEEQPSAEGTRALLLISKTIHATSNSKGFSPEDVMAPMNPLVLKYSDRFKEYLRALVDIPEDLGDDVQSFMITSDLLESSVRLVHQTLKNDSSQVKMLLTPDVRETGSIRERLEAILEDLGTPIQSSGQRVVDD